MTTPVRPASAQPVDAGTTSSAGDSTALGRAPVVVTVVESEACHFCEEAHRVLGELAQRYPLRIETLDLRTPAGEELMSRHRAAMSPLVLIDGAFFSQGRLPRSKLTKLLATRQVG